MCVCVEAYYWKYGSRSVISSDSLCVAGDMCMYVCVYIQYWCVYGRSVISNDLFSVAGEYVYVCISIGVCMAAGV